MNTIHVDTDNLMYAPLEWQIMGLNQTASGYGSKLLTRYKINYKGKLHRVYAICYSNSGTTYIIHNKKRLFVDVI